MPYLRDRNKDRSRKKIRTWLLVGCIVILLSAIGFSKFLSPITQRIGLPIWRIENSVSQRIHDASEIVLTKASVFAENDVLKAENAQLQANMIDYTILKNENDQLEDMLGRLPANQNFILATILTKPNRSPYDTIIVDGGSAAGIADGQEVYGNAEVPIGIVTETYATTALITLYSSPGVTTDAQIDGSNASVQLIGRGGGNFEMDITRDLVVVNGTLVVLPSLSSQVVASVVDIISDPRDPLQKVILQSPINIQNLKWVEIEK